MLCRNFDEIFWIRRRNQGPILRFSMVNNINIIFNYSNAIYRIFPNCCIENWLKQHSHLMKIGIGMNFDFRFYFRSGLISAFHYGRSSILFFEKNKQQNRRLLLFFIKIKLKHPIFNSQDNNYKSSNSDRKMTISWDFALRILKITYFHCIHHYWNFHQRHAVNMW